MASFPVKAIISVGAVSVLYAFWLSIQQQKQVRHLVNWLRDYNSNEWNCIPWMQRVLIPRAGLTILFKQASVRDNNFFEMYERMRGIERRQVKALIFSALAIAAVLLGTKYWGWKW